MSDNPLRDYKEYVRANLPASMSYNTDVNRYQINNHSFFVYKPAGWYYNYITKFGYTAFSAYAVNNFEPALVFDFTQEYYRTGGSTTTFDSAMTHSRSGNATMVDSDGLLKWAPHNLLTYSEQFDNAVWSKNNLNVTANSSAAPDGTVTADKIVESSDTSVDHWIQRATTFGATQQAFSIYAKADERSALILRLYRSNNNWEAAVFDLSNGVVSQTASAASTGFTGVSSAIEDAGGGWYRCSIVATTPGDTILAIHVANAASGLVFNTFGSVTYTGDGTSGVFIWGAHLYRSDLGGMTDVPSDARVMPSATTYVPTTSAARYLPRRGHHIYNGAEWVNEGVLVESDARTNLVTQSNNDSTWNISNTDSLTLTASNAVGPDGQSSLYKAEVTDATNEEKGIRPVLSQSILANTKYTGSCFVRGGDQRFVALNALVQSFDWATVVFDLSSGIVTQNSVGSGTTSLSDFGIITWGDDLYQIYLTFSDSFNTTLAAFGAYAVSSGTPTLTSNLGLESYIGTPGVSFNVGFFQLELGSTPSSYIPTAGATVTRAADTLTVPAANLPWPSPVVIGPELVTNGTFDTDTTGWTTNSGASISAVGGRLRLEAVSSTSSSVRAGDNFTTEVGKVYRFVMGNTYIGTGATLPDFTVRTGHAIGSGGYLTPFTKVPGEYVFVATSTQAHIELFSGTDAIGEYSEFDNVSVREINPLAVSIQMDGLVTYADTNVSTQARLYGWVVDSNNYIVSRLYTTSGSGGWSFDQKALGVEDIVFTSGSVVSPGILQPYDIASRHGSTFINGAVDGVALTADLTPVALPDLSSTNLQLGFDYMGTIKTFRMWSDDLGDTGIAEASA